MGVKVSVTIEGDSKNNNSTINSWFKSLDDSKFTEWIEKIKALESPKPKESVVGFITDKK
jgi:hypothetical protein